jgi:hypothetical protein
MYNTHDYRFLEFVFRLKIPKELTVCENGCFHPQLKGWETPTLLGPLELPQSLGSLRQCNYISRSGCLNRRLQENVNKNSNSAVTY